ncbi:MAG: methyltransferase domain-containing protein [Anaerolineae bacterium]|nr:methyltransferase domain-containing protein [Anaerolineae bacterium]
MSHIPANIERWSGFSGLYDDYRPAPPTVYMDILTHYTGMERPGLVVDIGCGTGLSTRIWAERADQIIGIEPSEDMRGIAENRTQAVNIHYRAGFSSATGLPDACADIVTISQALHWMQPEPTFQEVARILRPGGVFAAVDCDWPPTIHPDVEMAYNDCMKKSREIEKQFNDAPQVIYFPKEAHLQNIRASGRFRYVREVVLHSLEAGDAERIVGLAVSQGHVATALKHGHSRADLGLEHLREVAQKVMGNQSIPWYFNYRVRVGIM